MEFHLGFDLQKKLRIKEEELENIKETGGFASIFDNLVTNLVQVKFPKGVSGPRVKVLNRLFEKLDERKDKGVVEGDCPIEIEQAELDFLKELFKDDEMRIDPRQVRLYSIYSSEVERVIDANK